MLIGLNPSTANELKSDATIRRLRGSSDKPGLIHQNGFGGFYMMNLFPFVTPYPELLQISNHKLEENDLFLKTISFKCEAVIFCWGNFKTFGRDKAVIEMFPTASCFGKNANGSPKHPLYLKGTTKISNFYLQ